MTAEQILKLKQQRDLMKSAGCSKVPVNINILDKMLSAIEQVPSIKLELEARLWKEKFSKGVRA